MNWRISGLLGLLMPALVWGAGGVAVTDLALHDGARDRPVAVKIWYPTAGARGDTSGSYELAFRSQATKNGSYRGAARHPLILLSHGDRGSNIDQSWLAEALAAAGYVVAAPSHWLNTWKKNTPEATLKVWERPRDISFAISQLLVHPRWGERLDPARIGAAGHSAGGYTALALAGAIYSPLQMAAYCEAQNGARECKLGAGADLAAIDFGPARDSYRDPRIKAVVAMAPALGPGIQSASLVAMEVPALLIAATDDELLQVQGNAQLYASQIPAAQLMLLPRGGHFVFMPECTLLGKIFTYFHRFDICGHRAGVERARAGLHQRVEDAVLGFFETRFRD